MAACRVRERIQLMGTYRLFPSTDGPSSPVSYSGPFLAGVLFWVTSNCWFEGYWWWVCPSGQSTSPQKFALWQVYDAAEGNLVPGSVVTSGTLTAGQWNYVPLPTPLQLSIGNVPGPARRSTRPPRVSPAASPTPTTSSAPAILTPPASRTDRCSRTRTGRVGAARPPSPLPGRIRRRGHRPVGEPAGPGLELLQLLDGPPGQRHRPGRL